VGSKGSSTNHIKRIRKEKKRKKTSHSALFFCYYLLQVHVGEMGGNVLGFYGGLFGDDGTAILAHGYNGAFHLWKKTNEGSLFLSSMLFTDSR
jgi:hypothetical protein